MRGTSLASLLWAPMWRARCCVCGSGLGSGRAGRQSAGRPLPVAHGSPARAGGPQGPEPTRPPPLLSSRRGSRRVGYTARAPARSARKIEKVFSQWESEASKARIRYRGRQGPGAGCKAGSWRWIKRLGWKQVGRATTTATTGDSPRQGGACVARRPPGVLGYQIGPAGRSCAASTRGAGRNMGPGRRSHAPRSVPSRPCIRLDPCALTPTPKNLAGEKQGWTEPRGTGEEPLHDALQKRGVESRIGQVRTGGNSGATYVIALQTGLSALASVCSPCFASMAVGCPRDRSLLRSPSDTIRPRSTLPVNTIRKLFFSPISLPCRELPYLPVFVLRTIPLVPHRPLSAPMSPVTPGRAGLAFDRESALTPAICPPGCARGGARPGSAPCQPPPAASRSVMR